LAKPIFFISLPSYKISPLLGLSNALAKDKAVVFPDPEAPNIV